MMFFQSNACQQFLGFDSGWHMMATVPELTNVAAALMVFLSPGNKVGDTDG